jgi:two-component system, chemotaxis family, protein-glutamate methylesterase/glutaminase
VINRDIVVVGASAGGIDALSDIAKGLPSDLPAAVFVVVHIAPYSPGYLPEIISIRGALPAENARNGQRFANGVIYVAPPDHHLLLQADRTMLVVRGPKENHARPAVDPLFRSAALAFGPRVIGVVLSGGLDDGTAGLRGIKMCGGTTAVQDPVDALVGSMPSSALRTVSIDYCKPAHQLAALIVDLVRKPIPERPFASEDRNMRRTLEAEAELAKGTTGICVAELGDPSIFTCPECHGTLLKLRGETMRYRCHTGHAFTADSLLAQLGEVTDAAIWGSVRAIQESSMLMRHLAHHWRDTDSSVADEFLRKAKVAEARADLIREAAAQHEVMSESKVETEVD